MPEYLSPGVYVEEIDAGPKPIEGVSHQHGGRGRGDLTRALHRQNPKLW